MNASIKFNDKRRTLLLIIFAALCISTWLTDAILFSDNGVDLFEDLRTLIPTDLTLPSNYSDLILQSKTRSGRTIYWFLKHRQYLMILF